MASEDPKDPPWQRGEVAEGIDKGLAAEKEEAGIQAGAAAARATAAWALRKSIPTLWADFCAAVQAGSDGIAVGRFRGMMEILAGEAGGPLAAAPLGSSSYKLADLGRDVAVQLIQQCPTAECFHRVVSVARGMRLTGIELPGLELQGAPLERSPGLLAALLGAGNVTLVKDMLHSTKKLVGLEEGASAESCLRHTLVARSAVPPLLCLLRSGHATEANVTAFIDACKEYGRSVDEPDPSKPSATLMAAALGTNVPPDVLDLVVELSNDIIVEASAVSGYRSTGPITALNLVLHRNGATGVGEKRALPLLKQAERVFGARRDFLARHLNIPGPDGWCALAKAVAAGPSSLVTALVATEADPFGPAGDNTHNTTAAHVALYMGHVETLHQMLIGREASLATVTGSYRGVRRTLLGAAVADGNVEAVHMLAKMGALLPFTRDSPLIWALHLPGGTRTALLRALLAGWTGYHTFAALGAATVEHHPLLRSFLVENWAVTLAPFNRCPEVSTVILHDILDALPHFYVALDFLLEKVAVPGSRAAVGVSLHDALPHLTAAQLQGLLAAGCDLHQATEGVKLHFRAVEVANVPALEALLAAGLDVADTDAEGQTLLHWAALKAHTSDACGSLIDALAERCPELLFATSAAGQTPRDCAPSEHIQGRLQAYEERYRPPVESPEKESPKRAAAEPEGVESAAAEGAAAAAPPAAPLLDNEDAEWQLGPPDEPMARKRRRLAAMVARLPVALELPLAEAPAPEPAASSGPSAAASTSAPAPSFGDVANAAADSVLPEPATSDGNSATSAGHVGIPGDSDDEDEVDSGPAADIADAELGASLQGLPWDIIMTRDAFTEWSSLESSFRRIVLVKLRDIGEGRWPTMGACARRLGDDVPSTLSLWRCKFTKGGRIVFDVAPGWSPGGPPCRRCARARAQRLRRPGPCVVRHA